MSDRTSPLSARRPITLPAAPVAARASAGHQVVSGPKAVDALTSPVPACGVAPAQISKGIARVADQLWAVWQKNAPLFNPMLAPVAANPGKVQTPADRKATLEALFAQEATWRKSPLALAKGLSTRDLVIRSSIEQSFALAHLMEDTQYDIWGSLQMMYTPHDSLLSVSISKPADVKGAISTLATYPTYYRTWTDALAASKADGWVIPQVQIDAVKKRIDQDLAQLDADVEKTPYFEPLATKPEGWTDAEYQSAKTALGAAVKGPVRTALAQFQSFIGGYCGRDTLGVYEMPNGKGHEAFKAILAYNLGQTMKPETVHALGERHLQAYLAEAVPMARRYTGPQATDAEVLARFAKLPQNQYTDSAQMEAAMTEAVAATVKAWTAAFGLKQSQVRPPNLVVDPGAGQASYNSGSNRLVYSNVPAEHARSELGEIVHHEIAHWADAMVSGSDFPPLVGALGCNVTIEGTGLYAEQLGAEWGKDAAHPHGQYDDLELVGQKIAQAFRAARLVVDTGIHTLGWSVDKAAEVLKAATGYDDALVQKEIRRYIAMPGQADTYLIGLLGIDKERAAAKRALGADFDLVGFDKVLLDVSGASLKTLREARLEWVAEEKKAHAPRA